MISYSTDASIVDLYTSLPKLPRSPAMTSGTPESHLSGVYAQPSKPGLNSGCGKISTTPQGAAGPSNVVVWVGVHSRLRRPCHLTTQVRLPGLQEPENAVSAWRRSFCHFLSVWEIIEALPGCVLSWGCTPCASL